MSIVMLGVLHAVHACAEVPYCRDDPEQGTARSAPSSQASRTGMPERGLNEWSSAEQTHGGCIGRAVSAKQSHREKMPIDTGGGNRCYSLIVPTPSLFARNKFAVAFRSETLRNILKVHGDFDRESAGRPVFLQIRCYFPSSQGIPAAGSGACLPAGGRRWYAPVTCVDR
jgi:hypothetical protein